MHYVRATALLAVLGSIIAAAGCSGGSGGSAPPLPVTAPAPGGPGGPSPTTTQSTQSQTEYTIPGPIVALLKGGFEIDGGHSYGYVNIYPTSQTKLNYNGLQPAVGIYATVVALTREGGSPIEITLSKTQGSPTPQPTSTPQGGVPKHVNTAGLIYMYGGTPTTVPISSIAPYLTWGMTSSSYAAEVRGAGVHTLAYMNFWRNYTSDNPNEGYVDLEPGGAHSGAEAKDCYGHVLHDPSYGGGYEDSAYTSEAAAHASVVAAYEKNEYGSNLDAFFSDDTGAVWNMVPCGFVLSTYQTATNAVTASLGKATFVNTLNAGTSVVSQVGYAGASNVLGAMCESCYSYWEYVNNVPHDYVSYGGTWQDIEDGEAMMVAEHKIFWAYGRAVGDASSETGLRIYTYASFLLTYDPNYTMLQEVLKTKSGFEVFPETGLVPEQPTTTYSNVVSYQQSGGAYMRQFGACYYRGSSVGKCAVVINPGTSSVSMPSAASGYGHAMALSGYGVLDGGTASFSGSKPSSLAGESAAILFP